MNDSRYICYKGDGFWGHLIPPVADPGLANEGPRSSAARNFFWGGAMPGQAYAMHGYAPYVENFFNFESQIV